MRKPRPVFKITALAVALSCATQLSRSGEGAAGGRFHPSPSSLEQVALDVTRAMLREDAALASKELKRLEEACRKLNPEDAETFGSEIRTTDQAFHVTLSRAREYAGQGSVKHAFDEYIWSQRMCRTCHDHARARGLLPDRGPLIESTVSPAP